jgi:hypothetical protein
MILLSPMSASWVLVERQRMALSVSFVSWPMLAVLAVLAASLATTTDKICDCCRKCCHPYWNTSEEFVKAAVQSSLWWWFIVNQRGIDLMSSPSQVYKHYAQSTQPLEWPLPSPPYQQPLALRIEVQVVAIPKSECLNNFSVCVLHRTIGRSARWCTEVGR